MTIHYFLFSIKILTLLSFFVGAISYLFHKQQMVFSKGFVIVVSSVSSIHNFFGYGFLPKMKFPHPKYEMLSIALSFAKITGGGGGGGGHGNLPRLLFDGEQQQK